jgi:hypothetical protein
MDDVHTDTIEGLWSLVKHGIGGVYHLFSKEYLQTCLNEYTFRYNRSGGGTAYVHFTFGADCGIGRVAARRKRP